MPVSNNGPLFRSLSVLVLLESELLLWYESFSSASLFEAGFMSSRDVSDSLAELLQWVSVRSGRRWSEFVFYRWTQSAVTVIDESRQNNASAAITCFTMAIRELKVCLLGVSVEIPLSVCLRLQTLQVPSTHTQQTDLNCDDSCFLFS